jgi:hypothetical protein
MMRKFFNRNWAATEEVAIREWLVTPVFLKSTY